MLEWLFSESFLQNALAYAVPIVFAAYASLLSDMAGISAINIEGAMSFAALAGALSSYASSSWAVGLMAAMMAGMMMMALLSFAAQHLHTDSFLTGIALNTFSSGLCLLLVKGLLEGRGDTSTAPSVTVPFVDIPLLKDIPVLGKALFSQNLMFYLMIVCSALLVVLLRRTALGVRMKTAGCHAQAGESVGISTRKTRWVALLLCGAMAGLGGAYLSMANLGYYSTGMVAGRGFIGISASAMGMGKPLMTTLFAMLFGAVDYFTIGAQTVVSFPYELLNILPYLMTLVALIVYSLINRRKNARRENA